jgi:hypothetical protein
MCVLWACERGAVAPKGGGAWRAQAGAGTENAGRSRDEAPGRKRVRPPVPAEPAPPPSPRLPLDADEAKLRTRVVSHFDSNVGRRIYVQVDKPLYKPGETIWIRTWDLRARDFAGDGRAWGTHYQLVSPKGAVVLRKRVRQQNGYGTNDFVVPPGVPGGEYKVRVVAFDGVTAERPVVVSTYEAPRIKKKLELLRKAYGAGDEVTATVTLKRPTGEPLANHAVVAAVRLDGQDLPRVALKTNADGGGLVRFGLPKEITVGDGLLTVLVEDGGVTESVSKRIPIIVKRMQLSFFPEGGKLVAGLPSRVYFDAKTPLGKPADVEGRVFDDHGSLVAMFRSFRDGLGRFAFTPATGRTYRAEIVRPAGVTERYALPLAIEKGCALRSYDDLDGEHEALRVAVRCTDKQRVVVAALLREQLLDAASLEVSEGGLAVAYLTPKKKELLRAQGVARVTLFSDKLEPMAERVVFRNRRARLGIDVVPDRPRYSPRDPVELKIRTTDDKGEPIAADVALSVVDDTVLSFADDKNAHILSRLMLEPEVPAKVEEPNFYFDLTEEKSALAMDLLMGVRGYRAFEWQRVLNPPPVSSTPVAGFGLGLGGAGRAVGLFRVKGRRFEGALQRNPAAVPRAMPAAPPQPAAFRPGVRKAPPKGGMLALLEKKEAEERAARPGANRPVVLRDAKRVEADDLVRAKAPREEPPPRDARALEPAAIARQRVQAKRRAIGPADRPWGQRFDRGAALRGEAADKDWAGAAQNAAGEAAWQWAPVRVFPMPTYAAGEVPKVRSDFRETLYFAPSVLTGQDGFAVVRFHLSDAVTSFRVQSEGVGRGLVGRRETVLASSLPFSMNVKLPLEVSAGDKLLVPLTFTNERETALDVKLEAAFGPLLKPTGSALATALRIGAGSRESLFFPLEVVGKQGKSPTTLAASAGALRDELTRDIVVVPLGFPQELAKSGEARGRIVHEVDLGDAEPGTVEASIRFYPSPVASMTQGLEGLMREPSGCFEQASSSNYPNVMVLQYLQQNDPTAVALLDRTRGMLERGYRKLTGYESKAGGYEWFGGNPGHEALTAYGVLQFADMKKVFGEVDETMVARTAEWLRKRRDGRGGYTRNSRALDSFGRASPEVTDLYITYSLTEAGFGTGAGAAGNVDLSAEITRAAKVSRGTRDHYVLALAANTLLNVALQRDAGILLASKLVREQEKTGEWRRADHSITRSGGANLVIETTSLAVMALIKAGGHEGAVRRAVAWLNQSRGGYGQWGATQATVLALKAMTRYAESARKTRGPGTIRVRSNGGAAEEASYEGGRREPILLSRFGANLKPGKNTIELVHEGADALPYSLAIAFRSKLPATSREAVVDVETTLERAELKMGENVRLTAVVRNKTDRGQPMALARIGLPGGLAFQNWQLKDLRERGVVGFTETRAREVIVYFRDLAPNAVKTVPLDLVATIPGEYQAPASSAYLYYNDEHKTWRPGLAVKITR